MKLATFVMANGSAPQFGVALDDDSVIAFAASQRHRGTEHPELTELASYLEALPRSEEIARQLHAWAGTHRAEIGADVQPIRGVRFLPAVPRPPALIDFGLTPKHLRNSAATMLRYEFGPLLGRLAAVFVRRRLDRMAAAPVLPYYKGNHCEVIGDGDVTGWPAYTSYLDIEPELAIVAGTPAQPIAGFVILNDLSARDVQLPEMMGTGPARSKDFARGNGLGPFLVTPDEVPQPRRLAARVRIADAQGRERFVWQGSTAEYSHAPEAVIRYLHTVFVPPPGTVIGMGTVPDCTGLDNDRWLHPGDVVEITFDKLGTLRQRIPAQLPRLEKSRWPARPELARLAAD
jgi:2-keto-4-pentenoate hydratase/2-oxohepta-3-ene-1,7-dioic acid hydratase in catechol pathway